MRKLKEIVGEEKKKKKPPKTMNKQKDHQSLFLRFYLTTSVQTLEMLNFLRQICVYNIIES